MPEELNIKNKSDRLKQLQQWFLLAENAFNPWFTQAKEDMDFWLGGEKQWKSEDLQLLKAQKRPVLTFNHLLSLTNLVAGYQRENRRDIRIMNRRGGSKTVAEILTEIIKHIHDNCYGDWESSMAFLYGIITGKGWIGANLDFTEDILNGDIVIQNLSPFKIYPDPFIERYDMSDGQFIFQIAWLPQSRIKLAYPEKKDELEGISVGESDRQLIPYTEGNRYHDADAVSSAVTEIEKYRYRIKQCWWREFESQKFIVGLESGIVKKVDWPLAKIKTLLDQRPTLRMIQRVRPVLNLTTYLGDVELEHIRDPLNGVARFPIAPFFAYLIENNHFGIITQLKDPQREINKRVSQALHHLNQSANSGWIADSNAVVDWQEEEDHGSEPGHITKIRKGARFERKQPVPISEGHITLASMGKQNIRDISGVNPDLMGIDPGKHESGYLMELRRNQGLVSLQTIFDNFSLTKHILGRILVDIIQHTDAYSREEMLALIVEDESNPLRQKILEQGIEKIREDLKIGKYKTVVSESLHTPTARMRNFHQLVEARKAGLPIPDNVIVEASDLPMKEEIKQSIQMRQQEGDLLHRPR